MTPGASRALFVFAHQDDEYGAAPWIEEELAAGGRVACVYLTDGGSRVDPATRDAESSAVLLTLGVDEANVAFLSGPNGRIPDGALAKRSEEGLQMLEDWITRSGFAPDRMYAHAYEGGHPDHDAAHVIAAAAAVATGLAQDLWHFFLYNADRCRAPFFRVLQPISSHAAARTIRLNFGKRVRLGLLCWRYRSQLRTWLGLFPGAFLQRMILGRETLVPFEPARLSARPHQGQLLYERLFGAQFADVDRDLTAVRSKCLASGQPLKR